MPLITMLISFLFLLLIRASVAVSMILSSAIYIIIDGRFSFTLIAERIASALDSFPFAAVPFFILAAHIMNRASVTERIFNFASVLVGHLRGGLGQVNIVASMIFAGISGSAAADVAGLGRVEMKSMIEQGYDPSFSAAITVMSSTLGPIIPPSITLVIYGVLARVSVGHLFAAGLLPGILLGVLFMITLRLMATKRNIAGNILQRATLKEICKASIGGFPSLFAPILLLGGIFLGKFTPTEAGAAAVFYVLFLGIIYKEINITNLPKILIASALETAKISFVISAASIFGWIVIRERVGNIVWDFAMSFGLENWVLIILINILLIIAGLFIEGVAIIMISVPVLIPILPSIGLSPISFGVLLILLVVIGFVTPPVGLGTYIAMSIAKVPLDKILKEMLVFFIPLIIVVLVISFFPPLTLYLPSLIFK